MLCMFGCLAAAGWCSWAVWLMTVAAQSPRATSRGSLPPCSAPISPFLPETGHPFPPRKSPISAHVPCQAAAFWTGLGSPGASLSWHIDFFFPPPLLFYLFYNPGALYQIVSLTNLSLMGITCRMGLLIFFFNVLLRIFLQLVSCVTCTWTYMRLSICSETWQKIDLHARWTFLNPLDISDVSIL